MTQGTSEKILEIIFLVEHIYILSYSMKSFIPRRVDCIVNIIGITE